MGIIKGNFDFLVENYPNLFTLADEMESKVYYDPGASIIAGNKFFESLVKLIYSIENLEYNIHSMKSNVNRLYDYKVYGLAVKKIFNQTRKLRNREIHSDKLSDKKVAYSLCALSFRCACWFFNKYSNLKADCSNFDKDLIIEKNIALSKGTIDEDEIKLIVKEAIKEYLPVDSNWENNTSSSSSTKKPNKSAEMSLSEEEIISKFSLDDKNGSFLLNELSKLRKSSNKSIMGFKGFKDEFESYMHVDRGIEKDFKEKLLELSNKSDAQLIFLVGNVGDGKSHLLSYMHADEDCSTLIKSYTIHGDASESSAHYIDEIRTLESVLENFSDVNHINSNNDDNTIVAINLGTLSNFIEDTQINLKFKNLINSIYKSGVFDSDDLTYITSDNFLTIVNFSDYQLFELNNGYVSSNFISNLLNKITSKSSENSFYQAYTLDLKHNYQSPVTLNYKMLMSEKVKQVIIQHLIKYHIKSKKQLSARNILHFIYQILVPPEIKTRNMTKVDEYINDLLPVLLFNSQHRSNILDKINLDFSKLIRNKKIDNFISLIHTSSINKILDDYFVKNSEFLFFREYLLSENFQLLNDDEKMMVLTYLPYFALFFGKECIKNAFDDVIYNEYIKYLYIYNHNPSKLKTLFKKVKNAMFIWKGSLKNEYIIIEDLPSFKIAKELDVMLKPPIIKENISLNIFKKEISFKVFEGDESFCHDNCNYCKSVSKSCINLNMDYLLFEYIIKMNEGYKPNKYEKENLILFEDFISELISKFNNQLLISKKSNNREFKFKKLPNNEYVLRGE